MRLIAPASERQLADGEPLPRKPGHSNRVRASTDTLPGVSPIRRPVEDQNPPLLQIHQPQLWHGVPGVERHFVVAVSDERRIADLDDEEDVRSRWMRVGIKIRPRPEQHEIGFRLREIVQSKRVLNRNNRRVARDPRKNLVQAFNNTSVRRSRGHFVNNFSFEQFDRVILVENAGAHHRVVLVAREQPSLKDDSHNCGKDNRCGPARQALFPPAGTPARFLSRRSAGHGTGVGQ